MTDETGAGFAGIGKGFTGGFCFGADGLYRFQQSQAFSFVHIFPFSVCLSTLPRQNVPSLTNIIPQRWSESVTVVIICATYAIHAGYGIYYFNTTRTACPKNIRNVVFRWEGNGYRLQSEGSIVSTFLPPRHCFGVRIFTAHDQGLPDCSVPRPLL